MKSCESILRVALAALACAAAAIAPAAPVGRGIAGAAEGARQPSKLFLQLDTNRNGYVSRGEAAKMPGIDLAFADADDDKDGKLSVDEFVKAESIHQRRQMAEFAADSVITAKVKVALIKELELKAFDVGVQTRQGRVLLSGLVDDAREAQRAVRLAAAVRGVEQVEDALKLK